MGCWFRKPLYISNLRTLLSFFIFSYVSHVRFRFQNMDLFFIFKTKNFYIKNINLVNFLFSFLYYITAGGSGNVI